MNPCNTCRQPGACCARFLLLGKDDSEVLTFWGDVIAARFEAVTYLARARLPFIPIKGQTYKDEASGELYTMFRFTCSKLGTNGRCKIYRKRPQLCRDYKALSSPLCVHYVPKEQDDGKR